MRHAYILYFPELCDASSVHRNLNQEYACDVQQLFPGVFLLDTDMSYSYIHRLITLAWPDVPLLLSSIKRFSHRFLPDRPEFEEPHS